MTASARRVPLDPDGSWTPRWILAVVLAPTGVIYEQQCAGTVCDYRGAEGFLVPLGGLKDDADAGMIDPAEFTAVFHDGDRCIWAARNNALPPARLDMLRKLVSDVPYWTVGPDGGDETRQALALDESRLEELTEAWVPVITPDGPAILLWANCD